MGEAALSSPKAHAGGWSRYLPHAGFEHDDAAPRLKCAVTSKDGFSVVAPISVTVPSSTAGRSASCWALLKRCISR